tara:strand:+ start:95 stop:205 length:111 start_codon:yes stop_codon:yes gene_type:complete
MLLPFFAAFLAIIIYLGCAFAMYKYFLERGNSYMNK